MANNKEPDNYTNGNQWDKLVDAILEKKTKQRDAEKEAISKIEDEELEFNAKNQKNLSDKRANDDISKTKELKKDYYSLFKKDDKKTFLDKWYERQQLISKNINEINNKILTLNNNLNIDLKGNEVKYRNQAEKDHIDFLKNLTKIDREYANEIRDADETLTTQHLQRAYTIFSEKEGAIDYDTPRSMQKSLLDISKESIKIAHLQHWGSLQKLLGDHEGAERTSIELEGLKAYRANVAEFTETFSWTDLGSYFRAVKAIPALLADSSGEILALTAETVALGILTGGAGGVIKGSANAVKLFKGITDRLKFVKSKVDPNDFSTINKINQTILKVDQAKKDSLGIVSTVLGARALAPRVSSALAKGLPITGAVMMDAEAKAFDFASQRFDQGKGPLDITQSDRFAGGMYSTMNALGLFASVKPIQSGLSTKILEAVNKGFINSGNKFLSFVAKEIVPAATIEGATEGMQTLVENLQTLDPKAFDLDAMFSGNVKKLTPKQIDDITHEVLVSAGIGAMMGGAMKSTAGLVYPHIEKSFKNVKKVFNPNQNSELYLNKETITDVFNKEGNELIDDLKNTLKERTGISRKETNEFITSIASGMKSSQETILSFMQDKNIDRSTFTSLIKNVKMNNGEVSLDNLNDNELNLLSELRKNPESFEALRTALTRNNISKALAKDYKYMRMAKDRNLLQNIHTMNREELEKNFSFIKDDLVEQTDLYDLNIKQDTQPNNVTNQNQTINNDVSISKCIITFFVLK